MTDDERDQVRRETLSRAIAVIDRYRDANWRRLRVNDICADIRRLLDEEIAGSPIGKGHRRRA